MNFAKLLRARFLKNTPKPLLLDNFNINAYIKNGDMKNFLDYLGRKFLRRVLMAIVGNNLTDWIKTTLKNQESCFIVFTFEIAHDNGTLFLLTWITLPWCFFISHCVKNVQIRSFFWSEYRKIQTRKNSVFGQSNKNLKELISLIIVSIHCLCSWHIFS